jgi:thiamine pyrophosphokinase
VGESSGANIVTLLIFANGDIEEVAWIRPYLDEAAVVIAADGGSRHLLRLDHLPDVLIGDLDSLPQEVQAWREEDSVRVFVYPHDKNETDLELALLHAIFHYEDDIQIFGALGGRLDQSLANIMLLAHPALTGRRVELVTEYQRAWLVLEHTEIRGEVGDLISLIPVGGDVFVKETTGLRWPLTNEMLSVGPARGVSNEMIAVEATISVASGTLLCIHTRHEWDR